MVRGNMVRRFKKIMCPRGALSAVMVLIFWIVAPAITSADETDLTGLNPQPDGIIFSEKAFLIIPSADMSYYKPRFPEFGHIGSEARLDPTFLHDNVTLVSLHSATNAASYLGEVAQSLAWEDVHPSSTPKRYQVPIRGKGNVTPRLFLEGAGELTFITDRDGVTDLITCKGTESCIHLWRWNGLIFRMRFSYTDREGISERRTFLKGIVGSWAKELSPEQRDEVVQRHQENLRSFRSHDGNSVLDYSLPAKRLLDVLSSHDNRRDYEWRDSLLRIDIVAHVEALNDEANSPNDVFWVVLEFDPKAVSDPDPILYKSNDDYYDPDWDGMLIRRSSLLTYLKRSTVKVEPSGFTGLARIVIPNSDWFVGYSSPGDLHYVVVEGSGGLENGYLVAPNEIITCRVEDENDYDCLHTFGHNGLAVMHRIPESDPSNWRKWKRRSLEVVDKLQVKQTQEGL